MSDANNSHELRGSSSNSTTNFSQTESPLPASACVKTEPNYYDAPSLPSKFNFQSRSFENVMYFTTSMFIIFNRSQRSR